MVVCGNKLRQGTGAAAEGVRLGNVETATGCGVESEATARRER
jgi:hypothetical protein